MKIQPVIVVSPWAWLLVTFWKPILVAVGVFVVLLYAAVEVVGPTLVSEAIQREAAVPTMYIPERMRAELTALAPTPKPWP